MVAGVVSVPNPNDTYKLGFIGAGKMAESIARGVVKLGVLPASKIRTAHLGSSRKVAFESFGVKVFKCNVEELSTKLKLQHKEACTIVHERLLIDNTRDYGNYDPAPTFNKPAFKLIPN